MTNNPFDETPINDLTDELGYTPVRNIVDFYHARYNEYKNGKKFKCLACLDTGFFVTQDNIIKKCQCNKRHNQQTIIKYKKCPVCGETHAYLNGKRTKYKITNWAIHIKGRARSELFNREFSEKPVETPHVDWLKKNAEINKNPQLKIIINKKRWKPQKKPLVLSQEVKVLPVI